MKAIMYHYVQEYSSDLPYFRYLDIRNFVKQLDLFEKKFGFVSKTEWMLAIERKRLGDAKGKVLLTFDDAMSCHYQYVYTELKRRNLWGIFYVPTQPYITNKMLNVHRIHLLCGAINGVELLERLLYFLEEKMIPDKKIRAFKEDTYTNQSNYEGISQFKRILNYFVSYHYREALIDKVANFFDYKFEAPTFYLSVEELQEMHAYGNIIGAHTVSHPVMSKLSAGAQLSEIVNSFNFLDNINCQTSKTYCHPYGGFHSFDDLTIDILYSQNVQYSFNVEHRDIIDADLISSVQCLPRFDCNKFPFGKAS